MDYIQQTNHLQISYAIKSLKQKPFTNTRALTCKKYSEDLVFENYFSTPPPSLSIKINLNDLPSEDCEPLFPIVYRSFKQSLNFTWEHQANDEAKAKTKVFVNRPKRISKKNLEQVTLHSDWESITIELPFQGASLYGMGEQAGSRLSYNDLIVDSPLLRNDSDRKRKYVMCWNTDSYAYNQEHASLYQSHPWVFYVSQTGHSFGFLYDTSYKTVIHSYYNASNDTIGLMFISPSTIGPALYIIDGPSPENVIKKLSTLTGKIPLPPKWALGYHQSRYSYGTEQEVIELASTFRKRKIPLDCIWVDIDYMKDYKCFTVDAKKFPNPHSLTEQLLQKDVHLTWILDPGIKVQKGYFAYDSGIKEKVFVCESQKNSSPIVGKVWPGECVFPDFLNQNTRVWWGNLVKDFMQKVGHCGIWNDMNEVALFCPGKTLPNEAYHNADQELGGGGDHLRYHNVYGMMMAKSTRDAMQTLFPEHRPFVLTRANFMGGQQYCATWTGDNVSDWQHLHHTIPMHLNMALSGQQFVGCDIGGFVNDATASLFARWMGIGAFLPFCRGHSDKASAPHEPWSFGEETEKICKKALELRYRLLPYLYTLFWKSSMYGDPILRPAFFLDPAAPSLREVTNCFLLGADLMIVCDTSAVQQSNEAIFTQSITPALQSSWCALSFQEFDPTWVAEASLPSLYIRKGSILILGKSIMSTAETAFDQMFIIAHLDASNQATTQLYVDKGDGEANATNSQLLDFRIYKEMSSNDMQWLKLHCEVVYGGSVELPTFRYCTLIVTDRDGNKIRRKNFEMHPHWHPHHCTMRYEDHS